MDASDKILKKVEQTVEDAESGNITWHQAHVKVSKLVKEQELIVENAKRELDAALIELDNAKKDEARWK
jgi:hypothetical protein